MSDSAVQRSAETVILAKVAEHFGTPLAPRTLTLKGGTRVQVDGAASDNSIFVEVFARQGALKGGQQKKVSQDALKLITIARAHPDGRLVLAFADGEAAVYAAPGTWVSEALATWGVTVLVVEIDDQLRADIKDAQVRQIMVNPRTATTRLERSNVSLLAPKRASRRRPPGGQGGTGAGDSLSDG